MHVFFCVHKLHVQFGIVPSYHISEVGYRAKKYSMHNHNTVVEETNFDWSGNSFAMLKANWIFCQETQS